MRERWKAVVGFEGYYEVSDLGRVRSVGRRVHNAMGWYSYPGKMLKASPIHSYPRVTLTKGSSRRHYRFVHVLVLEAFVGPCPPGRETRHLNGRSCDNSLTNLKWGTSVQNSKDQVRHGTVNKGQRNGRAKLSTGQVRQIRRFLRLGIYQRVIADWFGVDQSHISKLKSGENWAWLTD